MFEDRWYQIEAEQALFRYFEENRTGNPVVAMPTGTGKSVVIGNFISRVFSRFPDQRIMMLTHVKELIEQNAKKLMQVWPYAPLGIYSAGLNQRDFILPIIYGGVASVVKNVRSFGRRDLLLVDECHLLSQNGESMYQKVIAELLAMNPWLRVIGFTATPYRLKQGMITDDGIFTDICYDITGLEAFNRLIAEGYLSPPIPKRTETFIDTSNVKLVGGEFNAAQLEEVSDTDEITFNAVKETCELGYNRHSWLMFASGVKSSEHIAECLRSFGIVAACVHSKLPDKENDARLAAFRRGEIRALVNMGKLTTGLDHPPIDLIGMLRATNSPGLWVQMLGRGTRPCPETGKQNCLVLDFARNSARLGPINDPIKPRKPGKGGGDAPVRICKCGCYNHASARFCINCGVEFEFETKIFQNAGTEELLRADQPIVQYFDVDRVTYNLHEKAGSPPAIRVSYFCGYQMFNEFIFPEHSVFARRRAKNWWMQRHDSELPATTAEVLTMVSELRNPTRIRIHTNLKYPQVLSYEY